MTVSIAFCSSKQESAAIWSILLQQLPGGGTTDEDWTRIGALSDTLTCNRRYRFDPVDVEQLFAETSRHDTSNTRH